MKVDKINIIIQNKEIDYSEDLKNKKYEESNNDKKIDNKQSEEKMEIKKETISQETKEATKKSVANTLNLGQNLNIIG
jgi:hypothetical protein